MWMWEEEWGRLAPLSIWQMASPPCEVEERVGRVECLRESQESLPRRLSVLQGRSSGLRVEGGDANVGGYPAPCEAGGGN